MKKHYNHFRWLVGIGISIGLFGLPLWMGGMLGVQPVNAQAQPTPEPIIIYEGTITETLLFGAENNGTEYHAECFQQVPAVLELMEDSTVRLVFEIKKATISSDPADPDNKYICTFSGEVNQGIVLGTYTLNPNRLVINNCVNTDEVSGISIQCSGEGTFTDTSAEGNIDMFLITSSGKTIHGASWSFVMGESVIPDAVIGCTPTVRGLSPSQPGDVIQPGASYTGPDGQGVGIIQERWFLNGVNTTSIVWDGKQVNVELQYTCLDNSMGSSTYNIPAYQPPGEQPPVQPGEQPPVLPGEEPPAFPGDLSPQDIAKVAGAILIGLGGLIGVGGAAVGVGGAIIGAAPPAVPPAVLQPPAGQPPAPEPPGTSGGEPPPDASPGGEAPKSFVDSTLWNLVKINTSAASTIMGTVSDLWKFPDSAETIRKMRNALDVWKSNPTAANADDYLKTLDKTFGGKNPGFKKVSDYLGNLAKGVDIMDAIGAGLKKSAEKGFVGIDQKLDAIGEVSKEVIKKGITWTITKNPVIGAVDGVVGGVSQAIWGNRIDLGAGVDKVAGGVFNEYDKASSGVGKMWEKGVTDTARSTTKTALDNARRHINNQVASGKLSPASGRARISRLEKLITGDK